MLFIWGFKVMLKTVGDGEFHCPSCRFDRHYLRQAARRWFTFFFIPVIPLKHVGEVVECSTCHKKFDPAVLDLPTSSQTAENIGFARRALVAHMVELSDNTTVARRAAVHELHAAGMPEYDDAQLDIDRSQSDRGRVLQWAQHLGGQLAPAGAEAMLSAAARVAAADGDFTDAERVTLGDVGARLGLTPLHIEGILATARTAVKPAND